MSDTLINAVANLIKVKGRFHTEQAYKQLVEAYDAALAANPAPSQQQAEDAEYVRVPKEPTTAMLEAMQRTTDFCPSNMSNVYRAMIAAAQPSQGEAE